MLRKFVFLGCLLLAVSSLPGRAGLPADIVRAADDDTFVPGEVVVKLASASDLAAIASPDARLCQDEKQGHDNGK